MPLTEQQVREKFLNVVQQYSSQAAAGEALGFTESYINRVLNGNRPLTDELCRAIGVQRTVEMRVTYEEIEE